MQENPLLHFWEDIISWMLHSCAVHSLTQPLTCNIQSYCVSHTTTYFLFPFPLALMLSLLILTLWFFTAPTVHAPDLSVLLLGISCKQESEVLYSTKLSLVQNFVEMRPDSSEEIFAFFFVEQMLDTLTTPLPADCHTPHVNQRKDNEQRSEEANLCNNGLVFLLCGGLRKYESVKIIAVS